MERMSRKNRMKCAEAMSGYQYALDHAIVWPELCVLAKEWLDVDYSDDEEMTETQLRKMLQDHVDSIEESFID